MEIIFLGTGTSQGTPIVGCNCEVCNSSDKKDYRLRSSVLIRNEGSNFLVDCGPDFRYQMLREGITSVDAIIFTHSHVDHTGGLDDIRPLNYLTKKPMNIYAENRVVEALHKQFYYIFENQSYPGVPKVNIHLINENTDFKINGTNFSPIRVFHGSLPIMGYRVGDFAYITDAKRVPEYEIQKLANLKILVVNALQPEEHPLHFTLNEAIDFALRIGADRTYFTHAGHKIGLYRKTSAELPKNMMLAYDGLKLVL